MATRNLLKIKKKEEGNQREERGLVGDHMVIKTP